jgi:pectate lyase
MMKRYICFWLLATTCCLTGFAQNDNDYSVSQNPQKNQAVLTLKDGSKKYYDTGSVTSMDFSGANITVNQQAGSYTFQDNVKAVAFNKGNADSKVVITEAKGWLESAYVKFTKLAGISKYHVYVNDNRIDAQLVRDYGTYGRADAVGLKAGTYTMKVVPVADDGQEITACAAEVKDLSVRAINRDGYAHYNVTKGVGAYNNDGTLKANARVLYVSKANAKTITLEMQVDNKGKMETRTGIQDIIQAYEKGIETRPLAIRIIGLLKKADMPELGSSAIGLQVKGKGQDMNLTIEGIGNDATLHGFGVLVRNCRYVELRNFAVMMHPEDGISFDTDNEHVWGHHLDIFYGKNGGGDKAKGDGSFDVKGTFYCTVSDNHFWDSGKCNLNSNGDEVDYVTYHHNWYDHSDSRHPRVRKSKHLHVFNNYFDGNSKYGVGSTTGSNIFVEKNYYRNCKYPMLISKQGSDINNGVGSADDTKGTFSKEDGGIIKAFDNYMEGQKRFQPYNASDATNSIHFDAYLAQTRDEQVPATVTALQGGATYNNFDTASDFYQYNPDNKEDVPSVVTGAYGAGRCEHGDFQWTFNNATEDTNYEVITALSDALMNYTSSLVGIFGDESSTTPSGDQPGGDQPGDEPGDEPAQTGTITASFDGSPSNSMFTVAGDYGDGKITYNGDYYKKGVKLNSKGSITFTPTNDYKMTMVLSTAKGGRTVKVNDVETAGGTENTEGKYYVITSQNITKGTQYVIKKGDDESILMLIILEPTE